MGLALSYYASAAGQQATDLGKVDFPTSASQEAQVHFLRGLAWFYNFGYDEARQEFRQARVIESAFAMAYWGEAISHFHPVWHEQDDQGGRRALAQLGETPAARTARASTPRERAYLEALEILFGVGEQSVRQVGFARAMAEVSQAHPDDLEAACLYALAVLATTPLEGPDPRREIAGAVAEGVLAKNPRHPGAAHAIIHAFDDRQYSARALPAARAYAQIAPASSHAQHMPAHIFLQLGMWNEAAASDEAAFAVSDAAVRRRGASLVERDDHPLTWLVYERLQLGQYRTARAGMKPFEEAIAATNDARIKNDLATLRAYYVIETRRWDEMRAQDRFDNLDELFAVGLSAARLGDLVKAERVQATLVSMSLRDSDPTVQQMANLMGHELQAVVDLARGRAADAVAAMEKAVAIEDQYPPAVGRQRPVKSSHELFGEILLELRRPADARTQFAQSLARATNRTLSVLGLARAYAAGGDQASARRHYQQVLVNWRQADADVPGLQEAKDALR